MQLEGKNRREEMEGSPGALLGELVRGLRERRAARAHHLAKLRRVNASSTAATRGRTKITATRGHEIIDIDAGSG
jgi:hypothetical protein